MLKMRFTFSKAEVWLLIIYEMMFLGCLLYFN